MKMNGKKVVVTGASGFVGSHLVEALVVAGANVHALIRYSSSHSLGNLANLDQTIRECIQLSWGDLRDLAPMRSLISGADIVFHLGALGSVPYSYQDPLAFVEVNMRGTGHILQASRDEDVGRLVLMSTSEVYGTAQYVPMDEAHPLQAQSPYAASKLGAEKLAESFQRAYEAPITIVRAFNVYGPRQTSRNVIPTILAQATSGDVVKVGHVNSVRDYTFVTDTIRALLLLSSRDEALRGTFNIGSGTGISVHDLIGAVSGLLGKHLKIVVDPSRLRPEASEVRHLVADARALKDLTGWKPEIPLALGLEHVLQWHREQVAFANQTIQL